MYLSYLSCFLIIELFVCFFSSSSSFFRRSWEFVSSGCYLIGAGKHQIVTGQMSVVFRSTVGAPVTSGLFFTRAFIHGKVFHSKRYVKVKQRNSYTVMFKEEGSYCMSYGHIECFAKIRLHSLCMLQGGTEDFFFSGPFFYIPPKAHTNFHNPPKQSAEKLIPPLLPLNRYQNKYLYTFVLLIFASTNFRDFKIIAKFNMREKKYFAKFAHAKINTLLLSKSN